MQKKIQQHYVWEHYLRAWCHNDQQLYCYRIGNKSVFSTNPEKIAKERGFYKLKDISLKEAKLIDDLFIKNFHSLEIQEVNREWINAFTTVFKIKQYAESKGLLNEEFQKMLDTTIYNLEEDHHTNLESKAIPFLESLKSVQSSISIEGEDFNDFLIFLCTQYFRTRKIKMNVIRSTQEMADKIGLEVDNIWNILSHIFATNLAASLYLTKNEFKWTIINNNSDTPFITGDQPVINTKANYSLDDVTNEFELYYPISPNKALLVSKLNYLDGPTNIEITEDEVLKYNSLIWEACEDQVFSNNKEILNNLHT